ncbi:hypothetical protein [Pseudomonas mangiferae]|uniref:Amino acid transport protein n=1 Tax=Pseudomonas mangiferae TaxID=2593654 RepID=A0A553GZC3_9PSED|nr:hypothetical protein [Pseudomonas mangiferae]TRX74833.1 hypothetical protein FM069_09890 [Pseudomonas mangiferae]
MNQTSLLLSVLFGSIGAGYALYGKRQDHIVCLVCGLLLGAVSFLLDGPWTTVAAGLALMAVPFFVRL